MTDIPQIKQEQSEAATELVSKEIKNEFGFSVSSEAQNKIVRLFTYLQKALSIDDSIVRDFRSTTIFPSPWWLADYPRDLVNLYIRSFITEKDDVVLDVQFNSWLRVEKKSIELAPSLPEELIEWVSYITPLDPPKSLEKIDRRVSFGSDRNRITDFENFYRDFKQGDELPPSLIDWIVLSPDKLPEPVEVRYIADYWIDHPELEKLLIGYIENDWGPWAEKVKNIYKANLLYDQLYALRLFLKNEGDNCELLLGHGFLTWNNPGVGTIYAPIFLTPLVLDFDASKRVIEIRPDPIFRNFVEISPLSEMDNPAEVDLDKWMGQINTSPFDFWHFETLKLQSNTFLNYLSPHSEDRFSNGIVSAPEITEHPCIWNSPVIFVRKRTNSLWSKYAEKVRQDIEKNDQQPTAFLKDLVGEYEEVKRDCVDIGISKKEVLIKEAELFFPLPWNDEQKRIVEQLESSYGVVVKGPPGTGKSHTIANLIARFLAQGKSVLVTSQTSKALAVLRDKLPENIRSLVVSQLHQAARRDDVLQQSISEISSNLGERQTKFSEEKIEIIKNELARVREEKASVAAKIRQYILTDSTQKLEINGEEINPVVAAKLINECSDSVSWLIDKIYFDAELNFTVGDLNEMFRLLMKLNKEDRNLYKFYLPNASLFPNKDAVLGAFSKYRELSSAANVSDKILGDLAGDIGKRDLTVLWEMLSDAQKILISIHDGYEREIYNSCVLSVNERAKWSSVITKMADKIKVVAQGNTRIIGHDVSEITFLSLNDLVDVAEELRSKVHNGTKLSIFKKALLSTKAKKVLENCQVDGRAPDNYDRVAIFCDKINILLAENEVRTLLKQSFATLKDPPELLSDIFDTIKLEMLVANITRLVGYYDRFFAIEEFFKRIKQLADLSFICLKDVEFAKELIVSKIAKFELVNLENTFLHWREMVGGSTDNRHEEIERLIQAIEERNFSSWEIAVEELLLLVDNKKAAITLNEIAERIKKHAPKLYQKIVELEDHVQKYECPYNLELAWKVKRLESWLDYIHNHSSIDDLQSQHERLTKREFQLNSELVTIVAWQKQIDKVTKKQRDALMAWSDAMRKYGKGTRKYANKWISAAQASLKEAKNAVPVWIMPLHCVVQMFSDPSAGMFDVVIFDEASQCDIRGLTVGYLGKKILVVGDPDQISPAGIFQDQEKVFELISRFLHDIPHKENFSITSSLFDLAKIRIPNMIQLNEHFRCVPEVIAFSNHHIYEGKLKPLRHPNPSGQLKPALIPVLVAEGYQNTNNKANEPEAKAIVEKIAELVEDQKYKYRPDGRLCTFGVISLLAEDQAKYIKDLLLKHPKVGERVIEERNITCGDAYTFQGDERDVMFLSLVKALDPNNLKDTVRALTDKSVSQRFNVAATRARDQVFLYHSIPLDEFRNPNDWRYKLLNWYYNPKTEELESGRKALKKEYDSGRASQFSYDVGNILIDLGYQVLPEYPVIGYRIDLVVQGESARLGIAIE